MSPGIGFGEYGDGHVRFALVENEHRIRQACATSAASRKPASRRQAPAPRPGRRGPHREALLKIGVAGLGTVGAGVLKVLETQAELLEKRCGRRLIVTAV